MSARRLILATALPAALLAGPVAGVASADTTTPDLSNAPGSVVFAAAANAQSPIKKIEVDLPMGTPMRDVTVPAMSGWNSSTTSAALPSCGDLTVSSVTWTATGSGVAPQQTGSFAIQVGSFPAHADQMEFTGTVTYADGKTVDFDQSQVAQPGVQGALSSLGTASTVTVSATAAQPQQAAVQPAAPQPAAPQPAAPATNPVGTWFNSFVNFMTSGW